VPVGEQAWVRELGMETELGEGPAEAMVGVRRSLSASVSASSSWDGEGTWAWSRSCRHAARGGLEACEVVGDAEVLPPQSPIPWPRVGELLLRAPARPGSAAARHLQPMAVATAASTARGPPATPAAQPRQEPRPCPRSPSESEVHPPPPKSPTPPNSPPPPQGQAAKSEGGEVVGGMGTHPSPTPTPPPATPRCPAAGHPPNPPDSASR
jgi:hypothetical protein